MRPLPCQSTLSARPSKSKSVLTSCAHAAAELKHHATAHTSTYRFIHSPFEYYVAAKKPYSPAVPCLVNLKSKPFTDSRITGHGMRQRGERIVTRNANGCSHITLGATDFGTLVFQGAPELGVAVVRARP